MGVTLKPIFLFDDAREAAWWERKRPEWKCRSWWSTAGLRSDRIVIVLPLATSGHEFQLRLQRIIADALTRTTPGGRVMVVDYSGIPQRIIRPGRTL